MFIMSYFHNFFFHNHKQSKKFRNTNCIQLLMDIDIAKVNQLFVCLF